MFRLMPRSNALLDGSAMAEAGHVVSERFGPVSVSKFFASLSTHEIAEGTKTEKSVGHSMALCFEFSSLWVHMET